MSAVALLATLSRAGVRLSRSGDRLRFAAPRGTITAELREMLIEHKVDLLAALPRENDTLGRLCVIANLEGVYSGLVFSLPVDELEACEGLPTETLCAFVRALRDSDLRRQGTAPADETSVAVCRHCGPVWACSLKHISPSYLIRKMACRICLDAHGVMYEIAARSPIHRQPIGGPSNGRKLYRHIPADARPNSGCACAYPLATNQPQDSEAGVPRDGSGVPGYEDRRDRATGWNQAYLCARPVGKNDRAIRAATKQREQNV